MEHVSHLSTVLSSIEGNLLLILSGALGALITAVFNRRGHRAQASKDESEAAVNAHTIWKEESEQAYARVEAQCNKCNELLNRVSLAFYDLLDDLHGIESDNPKELRAALRRAARKARIAVAHPPAV